MTVLLEITKQGLCKVKVMCIYIMPEVPVSLGTTLTNLFYSRSVLHG